MLKLTPPVVGGNLVLNYYPLNSCLIVLSSPNISTSKDLKLA
jgi:hypothetical protein